MGLGVWLVQTLIMQLYRKEAKEFYQNFHKVEQIQEEVLIRIVNANKDTEYGRKYGFADIHSSSDYKNKVPLTDYQEYRESIELIAKGKKHVLTSEDVLMFELTGGSGGAVKLIPYTPSLKREFLAGIKPWIYSLYKDYPKLRWGKSYWSITPPTHQEKYTKGGIPIGFEDDTAYFGKLEQKLTNQIFVRDKSISEQTDMEKFYFKTCLALLKEKNLTLISIWNPSYLFVLLGYMKGHADSLYNRLPSKRRNEIKECIEKNDYQSIWPKLTVISCWCDGLAAGTSEEIKKAFPKVLIQPKGILSTEAFMTLPYRETGLSILSYKSHYFEFMHTTTGNIHSYTELKKGETYEVIFTTSGGFYRYRIRDAVSVVDYEETYGLPLLKFVGKTDKTVDYHGEKLNELFIKKVLEEFQFSNNQHFRLFAYENGRYVLFIEGEKILVEAEKEALEKELDDLLCQNYHYNLCRDLRQLEQVEICLVFGDAKQQYLEYYLNKGKKLGDIKSELLSKHSDWSTAFQTEEKR